MHAPLRIAGSHGGWRLFPGPLGKSQAVNGNLVRLKEDRKQLGAWVRTWSRVQVGAGVTEEPDNQEVILFMLLLCSVYLQRLVRSQLT